MSIERKLDVVNTLMQTGCCKRCALRFIGDTSADNYDNPEDYASSWNHLDSTTANGNDENLFKKFKSNPCIVCLDLLQDATFQDMVLSTELKGVLEYDCDTFVNFISFPTSVLIREHSMEIYMREKFPIFFKDHNIIAVNRAWSLSMQNKLAQKLSKKYDKIANLHIQFITTYELEKEESSVMYHVENSFKKSSNKDDVLSRNAIGESLKTIDSNTFRQHVPIPPQPSGKALVLSQVTYNHEPIFIAGRYCKYSRNLGQTPWVIDNVKIVESSVQEIIFKSLENVFNCKTLVFSSSGREDFDVRTLGRGRPFFIKVCDPKITKIPFAKFRLIEDAIKQTNLVKVRDLQLIERTCLNNIKEGEQFKQKTYRALCIVNSPENLGDYIDKINKISDLTLQQKTPIRVYHRRSADIREKKIYSIKARPITGRNNLFELDLVTQAGTYVKEFVHGDLGRTKPSLGDLISGHVDIVALDVLDIHLDFPPRISTCSKNLERECDI